MYIYIYIYFVLFETKWKAKQVISRSVNPKRLQINRPAGAPYIAAVAGSAMASGRLLLRRAPPSSTPSLLKIITRFQSSSSPTHSTRSLEPHRFAGPSQFLGSWAPPGVPEEAQKKLALLRREYKIQVKQARARYLYEMELQRQERQRRDEARRKKVRLEREARKAEKAAAAQSRAAERKVLEEEFREMMVCFLSLSYLFFFC